MFVAEDLCSTIRESVSQLEAALCSTPGSSISTENMREVLNIVQVVDAVGNKVAAQYANSESWASDGYLTRKSAIVHETGQCAKTINNNIVKGNFLKLFPNVMDELRKNTITNDHINSLLPISKEPYLEHLINDEKLLAETACKLPAQQFSYVVRHWTNIVDALLDRTTNEYEAFQNRKLYLNELLDGSWLIHGELDPITGKILKKALDKISQKLWHETDALSRMEYSPAQQRADAIGYLAQGYKEVASDLSSPALNADVVIDISTLNEDQLTKEFLKKQASTKAFISSAHSKQHVEQILCDSYMQMPLRNQDGSFDLGRKVRTAPWRMKKQLALTNESCSVPGCITPSNWCDAHHIKHRVQGGETKLENLVLLCKKHHTMIHNDKTFESKMFGNENKNSPPLINSS